MAMVALVAGVGLVAGTPDVSGADRRVPTVQLEEGTGGLQLLGVHPGAAAQPTARGRTLTELHVHDGKVFAGYGDFQENTGPITISGFDPIERSFDTGFVSDTDAAFNLRTIGGDLMVPATDRRKAADFASSNPWADHRPVSSTHAFDMVTLDGNDLWLVGSKGYDAVAWRSLDGGRTWDEAQRVAPTTEWTYVRFYFAATLNGSLYLQPMEHGIGLSRTSLVFDGETWSEGPSLAPKGGTGWRPVPFRNGIVLHSLGQGANGEVYFFDGEKSASLGKGFDFEVVDDELYMLSSDGKVRSTTDLSNWNVLGDAPAGARSLAASSTDLFVGDSESQIWSIPRTPTDERTPPESGPSSEADAVAHPAPAARPHDAPDGNTDAGSERNLRSRAQTSTPPGLARQGECATNALSASSRPSGGPACSGE